VVNQSLHHPQHHQSHFHHHHGTLHPLLLLLLHLLLLLALAVHQLHKQQRQVDRWMLLQLLLRPHPRQHWLHLRC
jgi:hypothetical protein